MTLDRYADLFDDDLDDVADRLDDLRAASRGRGADFCGLSPITAAPERGAKPKNRRPGGLLREWRRGESNP